MSTSEIVTLALSVLFSIIGYSFAMYRIMAYVASKEVKALQTILDSRIKEIHTLAEEAMDKGIAIETNYRAQFKETNMNIQQTREDMITKIGALESVIVGIDKTMQMTFQYFKETLKTGDK